MSRVLIGLIVMSITSSLLYFAITPFDEVPANTISSEEPSSSIPINMNEKVETNVSETTSEESTLLDEIDPPFTETNIVTDEPIKQRKRFGSGHEVRRLTHEERKSLREENTAYFQIVKRDYIMYSIDDLKEMKESGDEKAAVAYAHRVMFNRVGVMRGSKEWREQLARSIILFSDIRQDYPKAYQQMARAALALGQTEKAAAYILLGFEEQEICYSCVQGELYIQKRTGEQGYYDLLDSIIDNWREYL